jgi:leader peptidase (prepilin peptidase) / N-methyltransferase
VDAGLVALVVIAAVFGLLIGSFLTVVVDRVPRGASIVSPGSACGTCGLRLGPRDLVPLFSWLVLGGKCRRCHSSIGVEAPLLEVACAGLFAAMAAHFGLSWELVAFWVLSAALLALTAIDLTIGRLPREITYVALAMGAPLLIVAGLVAHEPRRLLTMALGALVALAFMAVLYVVSRGGMGDGDVRLSPLLGAYLGWLGLWYVPVGLFIGFLYGAAFGMAAIVAGKAGRKTAVPFGPFLAAGTLTAVFVGRRLIHLLWPG